MSIEFTDADIQEITAHELTPTIVTRQLMRLEQGYPSAQITSVVKPHNGLRQVAEEEAERLIRIYEDFKGTRAKFVPASGAASRMFSKFFAYIEEGKKDNPFPEYPENFPFWDKLNNWSIEENQKNIEYYLYKGDYTTVVKAIIGHPGLGLADLPKALVPFHRYTNGVVRTPIDEHIVEGIRYACMPDNEVRIHFTVSPEHKEKISSFCSALTSEYEKKYAIKLLISLSVQAPSTDTVAITPERKLFRDEKGHILFRPGGHGALLANLQNMQEEIIFIKNIDNVARESMQRRSTRYKKILAGILLLVREQIFRYLALLENGKVGKNLLAEIFAFCKQELCFNFNEGIEKLPDEKKIAYLFKRLNRPIRVCGLVPNEGEPGGGSYWVRERDGSESLQIVEGAQLDMTNPRVQVIVQKSRYFNPVDLVCCIRNYKGEVFALDQFVNPNMGLIVHKTYHGEPLVGLEPPGLWNGAMADWITLFVEVPAVTFTPVKELNDLLRPEHQYDPTAPESTE